MMDLFGEPIQTPTTTRMTSLLNASHGFIDWWLCYPRTSRKVAKQQCLDKWKRLDCASSATLIAQHTEWMKSQPDWAKDNGAFICAPLVYLNQQRWVDWEPQPVIVKPARDKELDKLEADRKNARPPSAETLAKLNKLRGK